MPDNTTAGPFKDRRDEREERGEVTRTPGTGGAAHGGGSAAGRLTGNAGATGPEASARTGSAARDDVLGGRDTAAQERVRDGQDTMVGGRIPAATGPRTPEQERSPAREGIAGSGGKAAAGTPKAAPAAGRSGASREGVLGAEARVNAGSRTGTDSGGRLMPHDEGDKWSQQLHHAVAGFVDGPRGSVEEADRVLQEVAERFTEAVTQRRRALSTSWQGSADDKADTEQLRLALKDYRELTERLLRI
ncbi:hypothetical protein [Streptomyces dioscori]|uniref:hypothetical protein n=1 Tax=Streptomyces dioscori TaxID=2109333 RepID=UPI0018FE2FC1|nr:hypothetical protein [Streptomyces dioscori]